MDDTDNVDDIGIPEWVSTVHGDVKVNGKLHIWGTESHGEVITSEQYVRA